MTFTAGEEINCVDLKKKHRVSSDEPLSGRNLLDMARRGMKDFRKAMAFAKDKWDLKKNQPIESGTTVDDCIEYVRRRMYLLTHISIEDDNDDNDERSTKKIKKIKRLILLSMLLQAQNRQKQMIGMMMLTTHPLMMMILSWK